MEHWWILAFGWTMHVLWCRRGQSYQSQFTCVIAEESLEINYDGLTEKFYHLNGSDVVYGPNEQLVLGCMFPQSVSALIEDNERNNLMWGKGAEDAICPKIKRTGPGMAADPCPWQDKSPTKPRGMKQLKILLRGETEDNLEEGFAGSGDYRCYHTKDDYNAAQVKVYAAGSLLEIMLNGTKKDGGVYALPDKSAAQSERLTLVLECRIAAGAKQLAPGKKIVWVRNEQPIDAAGQFVFTDDLHKVLQIHNAGSEDGGVYMCVADLEQQNGKPITSRQYVVLKGDPTSGAASILPEHRLPFLNYLLAFLILPLVRLTVS